MAVKLVVFDMAGTTVEDKDNVHAALIAAFKKFDYHVLREDANKVMGIPKPVAIRQLLHNEFGIKTQKINDLTHKIHQAFLEDMISFYKSDSSVMPKHNAEVTFQLLKGKRIITHFSQIFGAVESFYSQWSVGIFHSVRNRSNYSFIK